MRFLFFVLSVLPWCSFGQRIPVVGYEFVPSSEAAISFRYPVLFTGDSVIDHTIDQDLKTRFLGDEYAAVPLDEALARWASDIIVYLDYQVHYASEDLVSLSLEYEGCGAYCSFSRSYFTYSLRDGRWLALVDVVKLDSDFLQKITADKDAAFEVGFENMVALLSEEGADLDKDTYEWAKGYIENCRQDFSPYEYLLHKDYLEIFAPCFLPNAIKNLSPHISLKYLYKDLEGQLKMEIK